jgi:dihydroorotate dehydrogenase (fumarate)
MIDSSTRYLGLKLAHPVIVGASPIVDDLDMVRRVEDAGAAAIVMRSLFEEQITQEQLGRDDHVEAHRESFGEAIDYLPEPVDFALGPEEYLDQIRRIKEIVSVPVIGSLNGVTTRGWVDYATLIEQAGADALELNPYSLSTDPEDTALRVEGRICELVRAVRARTSLPLAVKLSPFFTALPSFARHLVEAGADGLVLFNRFYEPDIDVDSLEMASRLELSTSADLLLRLHWVGILSGRVPTSLAVTGGVHTPIDALKAVMAGASAVQLVSAVLRHGPGVLTVVRDGLAGWLEEHEYESMSQAVGSMNLSSTPDPSAYERTQYMRLLQSWAPRG